MKIPAPFQTTLLFLLSCSAGLSAESLADFDIPMINVPAGTFSTDNEKDQSFSVENFSLAETELTWKQWHIVYAWAVENGYFFESPGRMGSDPEGKDMDESHPVTMVSWKDAMVWCNAATEYRNQLTGESLKTVYNLDGVPLRDSRESHAELCDAVEPGPGADGYRLPGMDEWEYAARYINGENWTPSKYASGAQGDYKDTAATDAVAWYKDNSAGRSHPVGEKKANALGIHDMSGNVWEWCFDWHPGYIGDKRVARGGSWHFSIRALKVSFLSGSSPAGGHDHSGFRVARSAL